MITSIKQRINWVDQLKGFGIILVIYGHNLPVVEGYIYSFHMPLFFFIGGLFHPPKINLKIVKKRANQILVPYFLWSCLLFLFWLLIGRKFGDSVFLNYSVLDHFLGIFYAQGGHPYMSWGVPMWFLPSIFFSFLVFGIVRKIKEEKYQILCVLVLIFLGFLIPRLFGIHIIWSLDISLVSLSFYALAFFLKDYIFKKKSIIQGNLVLVIFFIAHLLCSLFLIVKVDMYRSIYTNEFLFLLNAIIAIGFWLLFFKRIKQIKILTFFGKNTIPVLALHLRMLTVIKLILLLIFSVKVFNFNEFDKIVLVFFQLAFLYPIILFTNKYLPILNGKIKASARN
ncbi:MAG: acyltransferase family protein [Polaribacter sp.]|uniref:acyltransferase family protein n=1 Tax=Polaribacter sp. TaxID=1920175 RepID=UPI003BAF1A2C